MEVKQKKQAGKKPKKHSSYIWLGTYITVAVISLAAFILFRLHVFDLLGTYRVLLQKFSLAVFFAVLILAGAKLVELAIRKKSKGRYNRYNLIHLTRLLSIIVVALLIMSFLFVKWYAAAVSLGLISLILGFALQTPISSFIGWIYIIIRNPYRIGDRIQIDTFKGDVIEIGYVDTTLWEFACPVAGLSVSPIRWCFNQPYSIIRGRILNSSGMKFLFTWLMKVILIL